MQLFFRFHRKTIPHILHDRLAIQHKGPVLAGQPQFKLVVVMGAHEVAGNPAGENSSGVAHIREIDDVPEGSAAALNCKPFGHFEIGRVNREDAAADRVRATVE